MRVPAAVATKPAGNATVFDAAKPTTARMIAEANDADHGVVVNIWTAGAIEIKVTRNACKRAEQRGARGDPSDHRADKSPDHQHEALDKYPGEPGFPAFDRIAGRQRYQGA